MLAGGVPAFPLNVIIHLIGGAHPHTPLTDILAMNCQGDLEESELLQTSLALGLRLRLLLLTLGAIGLLAYARGLEGLRDLLLTAPACVTDERRTFRSIAGGIAGGHSGVREKRL